MATDRPDAQPEPVDPPSLARRLPAVLALLFLAPWAAECSWGGFTAADFLPVVLILAPMYGGAAVLIRETARHTGRGWPAIALLAAAFGMFQAGLVDQGLFNPDYLEDTEYADQAAVARATWIPGLGFSAGQAIDYIGNHIMLSMCAPIAIVESFLAPSRRHRPWLGRWGLAVVAVVYLLGSLLVFSDDSGRKGFMVSPVQAAFASAVVVALIGAALLPRRRGRPRRHPQPAPRPIWMGLSVFAAGVGGWFASGWIGVAARAALAVLIVALIVVWSRRSGWGQRHVLAAWAAPMILAAAAAYLVPNYEPASPVAALIGDIAVSAITLALIGGAFWRLRAATPAAGPWRDHSLAPR
jgi:hypothetical protein